MPSIAENAIGSAADLASYEKDIAAWAEIALAHHKPSEVIYNKSAEHAQILIRQLIWSVRKELRILSGWLNDLVFDDGRTRDAFVDLLARRHGRIRVLLDGQPPDLKKDLLSVATHNPLVLAMRAASPDMDCFQLRLVPPHVARLYPFHFLVADDLSFRFEEDRGKFDAIAQFGNIVSGRKLIARFEDVWKHSTPFPPGR
jgi:hypothetical protein